jgi:hypothetical protein
LLLAVPANRKERPDASAEICSPCQKITVQRPDELNAEKNFKRPHHDTPLSG